MTGEIAVSDEVQEVFDRVFGSDESSGADSDFKSDGPKGPTARDRQREEEEAEELQGLEGATDADLKDFEPAKDELKEKEEEKQKDVVSASHDKAEGKEDPDATPESTLPEYLRHAAKRSKMSDGEIDAFYLANPDAAVKLFDNLHNSHSDLGARYGQIGQMAAMQKSQPPTAQPDSQSQQAPTEVDAFMQKTYGQSLAGFNDRFGEGFVDDILKPLVAPVYQVEQRYQKQEREAMGQSVGSFFKTLPKEYGSLYGNGDPSKLTVEHGEARQEVSQMADWIRTGASQSNGLQLSVEEALDMAVAQHSTPHLASLERNRLMESLQKRSAKMTSRPTQRKTSPDSVDEPKSIASGEQAYRELAGQMGYDVTGDGA